MIVVNDNIIINIAEYSIVYKNGIFSKKLQPTVKKTTMH